MQGGRGAGLSFGEGEQGRKTKSKTIYKSFPKKYAKQKAFSVFNRIKKMNYRMFLV